MDDQTRVYWLFRCLKGLPGFAYRPNGLFEYWGVPLHEIPASVFDRPPAMHAESTWPWEVTTPDPFGATGILTQALVSELVERVDAWLAARHLKVVA